VDYYSALTDGALGMKSELTSDGVHPSLQGYLVMDPLAHAAIHAMLGLRKKGGRIAAGARQSQNGSDTGRLRLVSSPREC